MEPELPTRAPRAAAGGDLVDEASGLTVRPGRLTAVAAASPEDAQAIADRLGRFSDGDGRPGAACRCATCRCPSYARRSWSPTTARGCSPGRCGTSSADRGRRDLDGALHAACADDIVDALPDGLDARRRRGGPGVLRRPAAAAPARPRPRRRPGGAHPRRAHLGGGRPHRGAHRGPAGRAPRAAVPPSSARPARWCSTAPTRSLRRVGPGQPPTGRTATCSPPPRRYAADRDTRGGATRAEPVAQSTPPTDPAGRDDRAGARVRPAADARLSAPARPRAGPARPGRRRRAGRAPAARRARRGRPRHGPAWTSTRSRSPSRSSSSRRAC